ncbi:hypothetical protein MXB_921, partial [Myxobolus squamalis]
SIGTCCILSTFLINNDKNVVAAIFSENLGIDSSFISPYVCSINSILNYEYVNMFLSQFIHLNMNHCIGNLIPSLSYLVYVLKKYGPFLATNLCFSGQIWGILGTMLQYFRCRNLCEIKYHENHTIKNIKTHIDIPKNVESFIFGFTKSAYDSLYGNVFINGFDFPLCSLMGFSAINQLLYFVDDIFRYYRSEISINNLMLNAGFLALSLSFSGISLKDHMRKCLEIYYIVPSIKSVMVNQVDSINRYYLSTGRIFSFTYGALLAWMLWFY